MIWRTGRIEEALRGLDDDFEWVATDYPGGAVRRGSDAVIGFFRDWIAQWDDLGVDWELPETAPDTVLALVRTTGRGRAGGVPVTVDFAQVWTFRDGPPARMVLHADPADGRRAVGP